MWLLHLLTVVVLSGCGPEVIFEREDELPPVGWAYADSLTYVFTVTDTLGRYDMELLLEHGTDFPYQNFYVELDTYFPDGRRLSQPVSLQLADKYGNWFGDCRSESCNYAVPIQSNARFDETGDHRLVVKQFSREDVLAGVSTVGFRLVRVAR